MLIPKFSIQKIVELIYACHLNSSAFKSVALFWSRGSYERRVRSRRRRGGRQCPENVGPIRFSVSGRTSDRFGGTSGKATSVFHR